MPKDTKRPSQDISRSLVKAIRWRYRLGLSLIALMALMAFTLSSWLISNQQSSARMINDSGRQRMLSQKIGLLSLQLAQEIDSEKTEQLRKELIEARDLLSKSHRQILQLAGYDFERNKGLSPELLSLYFNSERGADTLLTAYTSAVSDFLEELDLYRENAAERREVAKSKISVSAEKIATFGRNQLLLALDRVVLRIQRESEMKISNLRRLDTLVFFATLALLTFELLFIFLPMESAVSTFSAALYSQIGPKSDTLES